MQSLRNDPRRFYPPGTSPHDVRILFAAEIERQVRDWASQFRADGRGHPFTRAKDLVECAVSMMIDRAFSTELEKEDAERRQPIAPIVSLAEWKGENELRIEEGGA